MPPELAEVRAWIEKAEHDRRTAELCCHQARPVTDTAAFHCQQAVEKLLKAFLVLHTCTFEKIHDLEELATACASFDAPFQALVPRVAPLTPFAVRYRYPGPNNPTVDEVRDALRVVNEVRQAVLSHVPSEVRPDDTIDP